MSNLGDYIRTLEFEINQFVNGTKTLAYNHYDGYLEEGGSLEGKPQKEKTDEQN